MAVCFGMHEINSKTRMQDNINNQYELALAARFMNAVLQ